MRLKQMERMLTLFSPENLTMTRILKFDRMADGYKQAYAASGQGGAHRTLSEIKRELSLVRMRRKHKTHRSIDASELARALGESSP